jgi:hypothetical protein
MIIVVCTALKSTDHGSCFTFLSLEQSKARWLLIGAFLPRVPLFLMQ